MATQTSPLTYQQQQNTWLSDNTTSNWYTGNTTTAAESTNTEVEASTEQQTSTNQESQYHIQQQLRSMNLQNQQPSVLQYQKQQNNSQRFSGTSSSPYPSTIAATPHEKNYYSQTPAMSEAPANDAASPHFDYSNVPWTAPGYSTPSEAQTTGTSHYDSQGRSRWQMISEQAHSVPMNMAVPRHFGGSRDSYSADPFGQNYYAGLRDPTLSATDSADSTTNSLVSNIRSSAGSASLNGGNQSTLIATKNPYEVPEERFEEYFRLWRMERKMTQFDVAEAIKYDQSSVSQFEQGMKHGEAKIAFIGRLRQLMDDYQRGVFQVQPKSSNSNANNPNRRGKRVRTAIGRATRQHLEACYMRNPKPSSEAIMHICAVTGLDTKIVRTWFQNRRQKDRSRVLRTGAGASIIS
eukprot:Clim_evm20s235 gene=Clim_evmTU20s235